jgi:hypothetical protein
VKYTAGYTEKVRQPYSEKLPPPIRKCDVLASHFHFSSTYRAPLFARSVRRRSVRRYLRRRSVRRYLRRRSVRRYLRRSVRRILRRV